jgi:hypothetical protein
MASVANISDVLEGHVALEIECVDRLLLNAYVPGLQVPGQVVRFLCGHLGHPIPSRRCRGRIGNRFRAETRRFVRGRGIPVLRLPVRIARGGMTASSTTCVNNYIHDARLAPAA